MTSTSSRTRRLIVAGLLGPTLPALALPASYAVDDDDGKARTVFTISSPEITESSSLVVSTAYPGLVYTTNDSGDDAIVYVLGAADGEVVGRTTLAGVRAVDIEALAGGSDGSLVVADIGDNHSERPSVTIYRLDQPSRGNRKVVPDETKLSYVGGSRDAESVLYDAETGRALVVSKEFQGAQVYASGADVFTRREAQLHPIASAPPLATDATFLPADGFAVIRTYFSADVYTYPAWKEVDSVELPVQEQGESVAAPPDGGVVWVGTEGERSKVLEIALPTLTQDHTPGLEPSPPPGSSSSSPPPESTVPRADEDNPAVNPRLESLVRIVLVVTVGALVLMAAVFILVRRRSSS